MVVLFAFSLQDQVEKYGAYVGLAAFIGLAVLTLLYFAQARELKRLRDWAGRAPERAQEMEARVVAQAEDALRTPAPAVPERTGTVGPAQPVTAGNGRPPKAPVTVPMGPRPAVAMARAAAAVATAPGVAERADDEAAEPVAVPAEGVPAEPGVPATGDGAPAETGEPVSALAQSPEPADAAPATEQASTPEAPSEAAAAEPAVEEGAPAEGDAPPPAEPEPARAPDTEDAPAVAGNGVASPVAIPRATPRPQPRPAAPLRAPAARSTTLPPRRPGPPPRRSAQEPSRAGRMTVLTLIAVGVIAAAIVIPVFVLGGDDPEPSPNTTAEPTTETSTGGTGEGGQAVAAARPETVVTVLNGTPTEGLASQTRDKLMAEGYSDEQGMIRTGNNTDQQRQDSVVLYADGERRQARDVAAVLDITQLEAIDPETQALADATDATNSGQASKVVVILGGDQSP